MQITINKTESAAILDFRNQFLQENKFQFVCNKCHDYGWAETYSFLADGVSIGYGSVWGTDRREDRDTIFEFFIIPPFRKYSSLVFSQFAVLTKGIYIESQSNDLLLTSMLYEYALNIRAEAILFEDNHTTELTVPDTNFRRRKYDDSGDDSDFFLEANGKIVASGGLMLNYNFPYADIYMQVNEAHRGKGFGSLIVQEIKKVAYSAGRVPAARCNIENKISKATLLKAGLRVCGFRLKGDIRPMK